MNSTKNFQTTITQVFLLNTESQKPFYQIKFLRNYLKRKQT